MKTLYMFITHIFKDASGEGEVTENMRIYDKMPKTDVIAGASVILDLFNGKVVKNRFSDDQPNPYIDYVSKYNEELGVYLSDWAMQSKENLEIVKQVFGGEQPNE